METFTLFKKTLDLEMLQLIHRLLSQIQTMEDLKVLILEVERVGTINVTAGDITAGSGVITSFSIHKSKL